MKPADRAVRSAALAVAYDAGAIAADLAQQHGIAQSTVHRILTQQGVALRGREWIRWGGTRTMEIIAGSQAGVSACDLAAQHHLSVNRVRAILARARHEGLDPSAVVRPRIPALGSPSADAWTGAALAAVGHSGGSDGEAPCGPCVSRAAL